MLAPAWTLELELTFYLLAPAIVTRSLRTIFAIIALTFAARFSWYAMGHNVDPWNYRFFPFELGLFVLGIATYRISTIFPWAPRRELVCVIFALVVASIVRHDMLGPFQQSFIYLFVFAAFLPHIFALTRSWKVDRFLADMSFPLYLAHWPIAFFVYDFLPVPWPKFPGIVPALASVVAAAALVIFVEWPVERWRQARLASVRTTVPSPNFASPTG
jgi:peptidoglycan/LPS O-acetylase OafA/YrhL